MFVSSKIQKKYFIYVGLIINHNTSVIGLLWECVCVYLPITIIQMRCFQIEEHTDILCFMTQALGLKFVK